MTDLIRNTTNNKREKREKRRFLENKNNKTQTTEREGGMCMTLRCMTYSK